MDHSTEFPKRKTARLSLRRVEESDWQSISYLRTDKIVNRFVKRPNADTKEKALDFIRKTQLSINEGELFYWSISLKDQPEMIGSICLWNLSTDKKTAELGYDLKPEFQKKGFVSEAVQEVLDFGFNELDLEQIEAFTQRNNKNSIKLLQNYSFRRNDARKDEENSENLIFELRRPEFRILPQNI